jgi:3-hydroxymyristoyl/3-hydroxydecanoyl-(acyl carrier protein) dehydratase
MDHHFRAFSFVDRITAIEPGVRISGSYTIPAGLAEFPMSLVAEATGQLAAWSAMAKIDFSHRPVAGLAGRVELLREVWPGDTLELSAELENADTSDVAYGGCASVNGEPVLRLHHCMGPMVAIGGFDDPDLLRARLALLRGEGAVPGVFAATGVPVFSLDELAVEEGPQMKARAKLQVPADAAFFGDHFPKRPVFPGTLLMNMNLKLVTALAAGVPVRADSRWVPRAVVDMKLRDFISPGELLSIKAKVMRHEGDELKISVETRNEKGRLGAARVELTPEAAA